jgi:hypothetical protein
VHGEEDELKDWLLWYSVVGVLTEYLSRVQIDYDQSVTMVLVVELTTGLHRDHCCGKRYRLQPDVNRLQEIEETLQRVDLTTAQDLLNQDLEMQVLTVQIVGEVLPNCYTNQDGEQDRGWVVLFHQQGHQCTGLRLVVVVVVVVADDRDSQYQTILPLTYWKG